MEEDYLIHDCSVLELAEELYMKHIDLKKGTARKSFDDLGSMERFYFIQLASHAIRNVVNQQARVDNE